MAAVLCRGIGKVLCLPCTICGEVCKGCGEICNSCCKGVGEICKGIGAIITTPFFPYVALTLGLNIPPLVMGVYALQFQVSDNGCSTGVYWLDVNAILCIVHIVAALYLAIKIHGGITCCGGSDGDDDGDNNGSKKEVGASTALPVITPTASSDKEDTSFMDRTKHLLCEDPIIAVYILIAIGWLVWQCIGIGRIFQLNGDGECDDVEGWFSISLICGWLYFLLAGIAFCISMCCVCCRD